MKSAKLDIEEQIYSPDDKELLLLRDKVREQQQTIERLKAALQQAAEKLTYASYLEHSKKFAAQLNEASSKARAALEADHA